MRKLQDLQFMWKPMHQEGNPSNPVKDCTEWTESLKNIDAVLLANQGVVKPGFESLFSYKTREFFDGLKKTSYNFDE